MQDAVNYIKEQLGGKPLPRVGVICGSGLSGLSKCLDDQLVVHYKDIPGFPQTTVAGHSGELVFGHIEKTTVVCMKGRFHSYEGHDMKTVTMPVKLFRALGVEIVVVTNAAGGLSPKFEVGDLMIITDHIGMPLLAGKHPLVGPNDDQFGGPRFPPLSDAYDPSLRQLVIETAKDQDIQFLQPSGTYCMVSGPSYETCAEAQMLLRSGADCVGMSTVPEVVVARHSGMAVLGLSLITNKVRLPGDTGEPASHEEVLETVQERSTQIEKLVRTVIGKLDKDQWETIAPQLAARSTDTVGENTSSTATLKERVMSLNLSQITPLEALNKLAELQQFASSSPSS